MKKDLESKQLQRKIFNLASIGFLIASLSIALVSIIPLHQQLKNQNENNLIFAVKIRTMLADEFFAKIFETSMLVTSRSKMRQTLVEYNKNEISLSSYQKQTTAKMQDVLDKSKIIVGVYRFDIRGEEVNHVGISVPQEYIQLDAVPQKEAILTGIWQPEDDTFFITAAPILDRKGKFVGHDILVFETLSLQNMVRDYGGLGKTGETILLAPNQKGKLYPVFRLREQDNLSSSEKESTLELSFLHSQQSLVPTIKGHDVLIFNQLTDVNWVVLVQLDKQELDRAVFQKLTPVIILFVLIIPLALLGIYLLLRPLTQRLEEQMQSLQEEVLARKKAEEFLYREKERLSITLRSIGEAVITTDIDGKIVLLNRIAEKLTGWKQEEAEGKPLEDVFNLLNDKTREAQANPATYVLKTGAIIEPTEQIILQSKQKEEYLIENSCAPIFTKDQDIIGSVLVFRDITQERKAEEDLFKMKKLQSVGVLAGGLAHDFNNILAAILGNVDLALTKTDANHQVYPLLSKVKKATIRAKNITLQLLTFSKGGSPIKQTSEIKEIIQDSAEFVLHGSSVICEYQFSDDLWLVDVDVGQIGQVIQNIAINSRDAMPQGGKIKMSCHNVQDSQDLPPPLRGNFIKIMISDSGKGIPKENLDKIFDPYFSTKELGSGLGLAVCYSIVQKHNGSITVQSQKNKGTTFSIYIPASIRSQEEQEPDPLPREITEERNATIMIMDDEAAIREMLRDTLHHLGFEVVLVENGYEAIETYREHLSSGNEIDITIMDLTIPGSLGGKETAQEILQINPKAKLVVFSGYFNDPVMANAKDYGFVGSLSKPFSISELKAVIKSILNK